MSSATQAILASGQWCYAEMYEILLAGSSTPLRFSSIDSDLTFGSSLYSRGFVITRGAITQGVGFNDESVELTFAPLADSLTPTLINGKTMQASVDQGVFDNAEVTIWDAFLNSYSDTSPGLNHLFMGRVISANAGRLQTKITITAGHSLLSVYMPRNIVQTGCVHALFDAGCTLNRSAFLSGGTISGTPGVLSFNTGLTQPDNYFNLGQIDFLSGVNTGLSRMVRSSLHTSGAIKLMSPLPTAPSAGDSFQISPGCDKTKAQCTQTNAAVAPPFNNGSHFRGYRFVPVVETLYAGGVGSGQAPSTGGQGKPMVGSPSTNTRARGSYVP